MEIAIQKKSKIGKIDVGATKIHTNSQVPKSWKFMALTTGAELKPSAKFSNVEVPNDKREPIEKTVEKATSISGKERLFFYGRDVVLGAAAYFGGLWIGMEGAGKVAAAGFGLNIAFKLVTAARNRIMHNVVNVSEALGFKWQEKKDKEGVTAIKDAVERLDQSSRLTFTGTLVTLAGAGIVALGSTTFGAAAIAIGAIVTTYHGFKIRSFNREVKKAVAATGEYKAAAWAYANKAVIDEELTVLQPHGGNGAPDASSGKGNGVKMPDTLANDWTTYHAGLTPDAQKP